MQDAVAGEHRRTAERARIEAILARYPGIDAAEVDQLIHFFRKQASSLDVALLSSNDASREGYRRFHGDHGANLRTPVRDAIAIGILAAFFAAAVVLLWDYAHAV